MIQVFNSTVLFNTYKISIHFLSFFVTKQTFLNISEHVVNAQLHQIQLEERVQCYVSTVEQFIFKDVKL